jgi:succinate dehydrogenase assembly factor 2
MFKIILGTGFRRQVNLLSSGCLPRAGLYSSTNGTGEAAETQTQVLTEPFIPPYRPREGEAVETIRARLLYQSRKRGMLENGLLLSTFAAKFLESMTETELRDYDHLINLPSNDWDIYYWATGVKPIPAEFDTPMMYKFIGHVQNNNKETRYRQPDLYEE